MARPAAEAGVVGEIEDSNPSVPSWIEPSSNPSAVRPVEASNDHAVSDRPAGTIDCETTVAPSLRWVTRTRPAESIVRIERLYSSLTTKSDRPVFAERPSRTSSVLPPLKSGTTCATRYTQIPSTATITEKPPTPMTMPATESHTCTAARVFRLRGCGVVGGGISSPALDGPNTNRAARFVRAARENILFQRLMGHRRTSL